MIPVILSGGSGTRLWPISRVQFPKQFAPLIGSTLIQKTVQRVKTLGEPWFLTTMDLKTLTELTMIENKIPLENGIYEPYGRNTGPAMALLCRFFLNQRKEDKIVGVFPADHLIADEKSFLEAVAGAKEFALKGQVVTLGVVPDSPATGFGYIEIDKSQSFKTSNGHQLLYKSKKFHEKPDVETAKNYLANGGFYWNAGIFIFKISTMAEQIQRFMPETWRILDSLKPDLSNIKVIYDQIVNESFDVAVMEKLPDQVCIPCNMGWSDLGSWDEVIRFQSNFSNAKEIGGSGNLAIGQDSKVYGFNGVSDLIVVDTQDALLISKKNESQSVKKLSEEIAKDFPAATNSRNFEYRPWGYFEVLRDTPNFKSKLIRINPRQKISYQSHKNRSEHWTIVKGSAIVILNEVEHSLKAGDHIAIPAGAKHRMSNPTDQIVEFIEIQLGTYFGEDDITRYQDDYGRI